ncbi:MAG: hypothetical protein Q9169_008595, partial [Polycauliona sp. 2 TL-2023]
MANLTSLIYHKIKGLQSPSVAPTTNMSNNSTVLPTSLRSGHPIYTSKNPKSIPTINPGEINPISPHPGIQISPNGTWKSLTTRPTIPLIEQLDLTGRFSYTATSRPKAIPRRPKNALKKGLRPTKNSELPRAHASEDGMAATREIYRRHSHSPVSSGDDEGIHSEPSPCKPRLMAPKMLANVPGKDEVMQNGVNTKTVSVVRKRKVVEIMSEDEEEDDDRTLYETTPPRASKVPCLMENDATAPCLPTSSSAPQEEGSLGQINNTNTPADSVDPKGPPLGTFIHSTAPLTISAANDNHNDNH